MLAVALDVTNPEQVASAVHQADERFGGDPARAAAAIITAVESSEPPAFLFLGADALAAYRYIADRRASEIARWENLTTGTNFDA